MTKDYKNQDDEFWKKKLPTEVYEVCRLGGTERAGTGKYDHFYEDGTYYCACCGAALYSSNTKFDSGTGWPSFFQPLPNAIEQRADPKDHGRFAMPRTEVICTRCGAHLGHVFDDGPAPTGKRFCMNSLALQFEAQDPTSQGADRK